MVKRGITSELSTPGGSDSPPAVAGGGGKRTTDGNGKKCDNGKPDLAPLPPKMKTEPGESPVGCGEGEVGGGGRRVNWRLAHQIQPSEGRSVCKHSVEVSRSWVKGTRGGTRCLSRQKH